MLRNIYLLGDIGYYGKKLKNCVNNIKKNLNIDDIIVLLGDNFYPMGIQSKTDLKINEFNKIFDDISVPIYSILGNHDYMLNPTAQINLPIWNMHNFYFKKSYENVDLYFMDTILFDIDELVPIEKIEEVHNDTIHNITLKQLKWFVNELKINTEKPKIVFGHYPIMTNGFYYERMNVLYSLLIDIFEKYNVQLYISGHEHNIQYIKHKVNNNYILNQVIIGSSSQKRNNSYVENNDMYDCSEIFYGKISLFNINEKNKIEYINSNGITKYKYYV
jgi:tartrate-resistant acid phosphatase type 5